MPSPLHLRVLTERLAALTCLLVTTALACGGGEAGASAASRGERADAGGQTSGSGGDGSAPGSTNALAADDPGPPASYFGSKCAVLLDGETRPGPECLSSPIESKGGRTHLFLNFCIASGSEDRCAGNAPPIYASLVLGLPAWREATVTQAERALVRVTLPDGRRYAAGGTADVPLPIDLRIAPTPHPTEKVLRATLRINVPRVDAPGPALRLQALIP